MDTSIKKILPHSLVGINIQYSMSSTNWAENLTSGLVIGKGKPNKVSTGYITKPIIRKQIPEHLIPTLEVINDNNRNRGLMKFSNKQFSAHRAMSFFGQE